MRRLGISLYPEKSNIVEMKQYIDKAHKIGVKKVFTSLLQITKPVDDIIAEFQTINQYAKDKGMEVMVDVSPRIFDQLNISYNNLTFFKEMKADGLRLDATFSGQEEALMTFNPHHLKIEINMSNDVHTLDTIFDYAPNKYQLLGSHNFYPHRYTGLSVEFFEKCSQRFINRGIRTAAFVTSQNRKTFGPWPVEDGLPTLELHRDLPLDVQIKHHISLGLVDDILISNCYPSDEEMQLLANLNLDILTLDISTVPNLSDVENDILFNMLHFNRGDINDNLIRSTQSRVKYKGTHFPITNAVDIIEPGDILIESSEYGHYAGELQIAKTKMKNSGKTNIVGKIREEELFLLETIKPWQKFMFRQKTGEVFI